VTLYVHKNDRFGGRRVAPPTNEAIGENESLVVITYSFSRMASPVGRAGFAGLPAEPFISESLRLCGPVFLTR